MSNRKSGALIVSDGGLASLVAVWREVVRVGRARSTEPRVQVREELNAVISGRKAGATVVWRAPGLSTGAGLAAAVQAEMAGFELIEGEGGVLAGESGGAGVGGAAENALLLSACGIAIGLGLSRVVWPVHLGPDAGDRAVDAYDRANVVSHLAAIDLLRQGGAVGISIETPVVELSDLQVLELAMDLDAPVPRPVRGAAAFGEGAAWWCEREGSTQCGVCGPCGRWGVAWGAVDPEGVLSAV